MTPRQQPAKSPAQPEHCERCECFEEVIQPRKYRCSWNKCFMHPKDVCICKPSQFHTRTHPAPKPRPPISTNGSLPEVGQIPDGSSRAPESGMCKGSSANDRQPPAPAALADVLWSREYEYSKSLKADEGWADSWARNEIESACLEHMPGQRVRITITRLRGEQQGGDA